MHQLLGIVVPIRDDITKQQAIDRADAYADSIVETYVEFDYHQSYEETVEHWKAEANIFRTDTVAGKRTLGEIKEAWKKTHIEMLRKTRESLKKTDDKILSEWTTLCDIRSIGSYMESPLFGEDFGYISDLNVFDRLEPSWVVFLDFHF